MPRLDGSGPLGAGPGTGRLFGRCAVPSATVVQGRPTRTVTRGLGWGMSLAGVAAGVLMGLSAQHGFSRCFVNRKEI